MTGDWGGGGVPISISNGSEQCDYTIQIKKGEKYRYPFSA